MVRMTIEVPEEALAALREDVDGFSREMRLAAAVKWYELRRVSQDGAAEIAGLSPTEFAEGLARYGVSPSTEADDDIRSGKTKSFGSVDEMLGSLKQPW